MNRIRVGAIAVLIFVSSFHSLTANAGTSAAVEAPVASVGGQAISAQELSARTAAKLAEEDEIYAAQARQYKLQHDADREAYIERELNQLVADKVLALEAAAKKTTPPALLKSLQVPAVSDAAVREFYDSKKGPDDPPYEEMAPKIKAYLQKQATDDAQLRYLATLRAKYPTEVIREPMRIVVPAVGPSHGPADAVVTIVEFSDFQCPYCGKFEPNVREVIAKYPNKIRLVYRHLPLSNIHPHAEKAAEAAVCAEQQGKFWEMHDLLFAEQSKLAVDDLKAKAKRIGLNEAAFDECLTSGKAAAIVKGDVSAADELGISSTPASFINGRFVKGVISVDALSAIIDDELQRVALTARR